MDFASITLNSVFVNLQDVHGQVHVDLDCTMQFRETAAYDPIFWLHHTFIDKVLFLCNISY